MVQEYTKRGTNSLLKLQSAFNIGLDIFDATVTQQGRDGLYWNWQAKGEEIQKLADNLLLVSSLGIQLSPDQLLPVKQFSLGGINSVRGYPQNFLVSDNGLVAKGEIQFSLLQSEHSEFKVGSFVEGGIIWNNQQDLNGTTDLLSVGFDLEYSIFDTLNLRVDYGIPLTELDDAEQNSSSRTTLSIIFSP